MRDVKKDSGSEQTDAVDRRTMLKRVGGGALLAAAGGLLPKSGPLVGGSVSAKEAAAAEGDLAWMPAWQIRDLIASRDVSATEVLDLFLSRIEEHDGTLKAFKTVDASGARTQAKQADDAVARGDRLGTLHGIPISVKEHIAVAGLPVMALGSSGGGVAKRDALGVERLRQAGAVIVGTNTMMGTSATARGRYNWEAEARNPWDPGRVPGWSSSGGAAAAAARLLPITIGSDGGGSTRLPAAYSGIVGVHPTMGLIPKVSHDTPRILSLTGTIGPLCRDVVDAAITVQAMAGPDGRDFTCIQTDPPDYRARIDAGVEGMRFAWTDDFGFTGMYALEESRRVIAHVREAAMGLSTLGATVESTSETWEDFFQGQMTTSYLFRGAAPIPAPSTEAWNRALDTRQSNWQRFRKVLREHDLMLSVTSQLTARTVEEWDAAWTKDHAKFAHNTFAGVYTSHTFMFNWLGFPAVSVPCGFVDGLPVGLQIIGWPGSDDKILRVAHAFLDAFPRDERPRVS